MAYEHDNDNDALTAGHSIGDGQSLKKPFVEPKLRFIEPKLTRHGDVKDVTHGNEVLGTFNP